MHSLNLSYSQSKFGQVSPTLGVTYNLHPTLAYSFNHHATFFELAEQKIAILFQRIIDSLLYPYTLRNTFFVL